MKKRFKTHEEFMDFLDKSHQDYLKNTEQGRKEDYEHRKWLCKEAIKEEKDKKQKEQYKQLMIDIYVNLGYSWDEAERIFEHNRKLKLPPLITLKPPPFKQKYILNWPDPVGQVRL